ncbi:hypothetical protein [Microlunatus speluncae]|nr:hypothetical protein [Microlunatus speluncae]
MVTVVVGAGPGTAASGPVLGLRKHDHHPKQAAAAIPVSVASANRAVD